MVVKPYQTFRVSTSFHGLKFSAKLKITEDVSCYFIPVLRYFLTNN